MSQSCCVDKCLLKQALRSYAINYTKSSTTNVLIDPVRNYTKVVDVSLGAFNNTSGLYIVPKDGLYEIHIDFIVINSSSALAKFWAAIFVNNIEVAKTTQSGDNVITPADDIDSSSINVIKQLNAGGIVKFVIDKDPSSVALVTYTLNISITKLPGL